ncbi:bifunctional diaminohydroxyphosphoribosylaminopyrimidine deaminase/5-amino-6-(5-phosphoribosylamino)uracil reductase RibD [Ruixingdingia sedimenti]|uniref:Riboflavin biosynthesis protein RibD n=1 Tax=Ruixingdingia sedimenti TaxID=3073604 RepID=A0ABU1FCI1_9RHOB|nr:bifunctional diaminohydroxyphosphoribosylaminopyrimidine deaminase/5-amino-6-(5-phosphoribosylamino)uracil reductase RibD [Xinfangfangia sp. LG-4]MDR5654601.1 bifunctional diaminohydroxyphosphoribosylaminopyrimidine deaminase/5-amino-6-(5-phosphoribosylamino)uracil reductase RibD [Xinfangfangia sp. LG-4]
MSADNDARHMRHALALAARGLGRVWPNPAVGCVIVAGGRIVGRGWTQPGGRPHAEPGALAQAGAAARGATAYVSLEPCAHHGKTPPCAAALAAAGVARVVTALEDPDPRVAGGGHAMLRAAGVEVATGVMTAEAARLNRGFLSRITRGRPMVTLKLATSFDGRIATGAGESRWITGAEARARVHLMRATHDAVLVGGGTARADDPELTVRGLGIAHRPVRVIAAATLDLPRGGRLAASAGQAPLWLVHGPDAPAAARAYWQGLGARLVEVAAPGGRIDPGAMLAQLGAAGLTRVFCEGGGQLAAALLDSGLVDELVGFTAGLMLGADGRPAIGALAPRALAAMPRFRLIETLPVGGDVLHRWELA